MASKWLKGKEQLFKQFKEQKEKEEDSKQAGPRRSDIVYPTPQKGTVDKPKNYIKRLLIDPNDNFYKSFFYHMYQSAKTGKWTFVFCPKTYSTENYCPFCAATLRLYKGSKEDKSLASIYKRKRKHVVNSYIVKDPRDVEADSEEKKTAGKVFLYEFPDAVESKIQKEINDEEYGAGMTIFDPGEDGLDFILRVGATKPMEDGKTFPDYSDSKFSTKPYTLGDDKKVEQIMEMRHDLDEYLKSMQRTDEELKSLIEDEMLMELVEDDYDRLEKQKKAKEKVAKKFPEKSEEMDEAPFDNDQDTVKETIQESSNEESKEFSDDELLEELENL